MEFCQDAQFKLEAIPSSTVEYVENLTFLDTIQEKVNVSASVKIYITQIPSLREAWDVYPCRLEKLPTTSLHSKAPKTVTTFN